MIRSVPWQTFDFGIPRSSSCFRALVLGLLDLASHLSLFCARAALEGRRHDVWGLFYGWGPQLPLRLELAPKVELIGVRKVLPLRSRLNVMCPVKFST